MKEVSTFSRLHAAWEQGRRIRKLRRRIAKNADSIYHQFERTQSVFVHIPKTAGISVGQSLYGDDLKWGHHTAQEIKEIFGSQKFDEYFKFAFVRNPWARLHSAYHFLQAGGINRVDKEYADNVLSKYSCFEHFVLEGLDDQKVKKGIHFLPQCAYLEDAQGRSLVDFVGRLENISEDFTVICNKLGKRCSLKFINRNQSKLGYCSAYSSEMRDKVSEVYARDVNKLQYDFQGQH